MNKELKIWKILNYESRDLFLILRSGTLRQPALTQNNIQMAYHYDDRDRFIPLGVAFCACCTTKQKKNK